MLASVNRPDNSNAFYERLVLSEKNAQGDNCKLDKRGIRVANIFQRVFGRSTDVKIDGKTYHLNTNSLNKYHTRILSSKNPGNETDRKVIKLTKLVKGPSISKARAELLGFELSQVHKANFYVPTKDSFKASGPSLTSPEVLNAVNRHTTALQTFEEAKGKLGTAKKNRLEADQKEIIKQAIHYVQAGVKEIRNLVSFALDNKSSIGKELEQLLTKIDKLVPLLSKKTELSHEDAEQLVFGFESLIRLVSSNLLTVYKEVEELVKKVDRNNLVSGNTFELISNAEKLVGFACGILKSALQKGQPLVALAESAHSNLKKIQAKKVTSPKSRTTRIVLRVVKKLPLYKTARSSVYSCLTEKKESKKSVISRVAKRVSRLAAKQITSLILNNKKVALEEVLRLIMKDFKTAQAKSRTSDKNLIEAEKAYSAAENNFSKTKKALVNLRKSTTESTLELESDNFWDFDTVSITSTESERARSSYLSHNVHEYSIPGLILDNDSAYETDSSSRASSPSPSVGSNTLSIASDALPPSEFLVNGLALD